MTEPLHIVGIDTERVGRPRNDGTPGSALYAVPLKLSRMPTIGEARLLVHFWDNPSSWSTMHRRGIARIQGDSLVLDGTTIEEVRDHHISTVRGAVAATNTANAIDVAAEARDGELDDARVAEHKANVLKVAAEIDLN